MKKLYLVSREVYAESVDKAIKSRGKVYKVEIAADENQPEKDDGKKVGFQNYQLKNKNGPR